MLGVSCPRCGGWLTYEELDGMGEVEGRFWFMLGLFNLLFRWVITALAANRRTGYCRCYRCGFRWRSW